ncbi:MAG: YdcF family protein [Xanthomonadales bacterium]|nr:YdcF family protein [Xanthomonadales bacterium]
MNHLLLSPLSWLAFAALVLAIFNSRLPPRWRRCFQAVIVVSALLCTPVCANALLKLAERGATASRCGTANHGWPIVLLSAGFDHPPESNDDVAALAIDSLERLQAARDQARREPSAIMFVSGGGPYRIAEATVIAGALERFGLAPARLRVETHSMTTWDNAFNLRNDVRQAQLVTSPEHMPRAVIAFRAAGIDVCAAPAPSSAAPMDGVGYFVPGRTALAKSELALHELAGRIAYAWRASRVHAASSRS